MILNRLANFIKYVKRQTMPLINLFVSMCTQHVQNQFVIYRHYHEKIIQKLWTFLAFQYEMNSKICTFFLSNRSLFWTSLFCVYRKNKTFLLCVSLCLYVCMCVCMCYIGLINIQYLVSRINPQGVTPRVLK